MKLMVGVARVLLLCAVLLVLPAIAASQAPPRLTLGLNQSSLQPGDTHILTATVTPGGSASPVDVYLALQLPDQTLFFYQSNGSFTAEVHPLVRNWTVAPFSGEVFRYTFSGGEPGGPYTWYAAFTAPGTLNFIGEIAQAPFTFSMPAGGELKITKPTPGFAIIQNTSIRNYSDPVVAQSVILVAPTVGNNQEGIWTDPLSELQGKLVECYPHIPGLCKHHYGYSAFLNNGMTDKGYFLQVGLYFTNKATVAADGKVSPGDQNCQSPVGCFGDGLVVWVGALTTGVQNPDLGAHALFSAGTSAQPTGVPYIPGHHYYTTITYTSGVWWTCAADLADISTYQCQSHPNAEGDHLIEDKFGTNIFVETWNQNRSWAGGFTIQWAAYDARLYVNGLPPQPWSSQAKWTLHSCEDAWPPENAIVGGLVPDGRQFNDGWAFFNASSYIPPFCF